MAKNQTSMVRRQRERARQQKRREKQAKREERRELKKLSSVEIPEDPAKDPSIDWSAAVRQTPMEVLIAADAEDAADAEGAEDAEDEESSA